MITKRLLPMVAACSLFLVGTPVHAAAPTFITFSPLVSSGSGRGPVAMAPAGTLNAGQAVPLTLQTDPNATVYAWLSGPGSADAGSTHLGSHAVPVTADDSGQIAVTYTAISSLVGMATLHAVDNPQAVSVSAWARYNYARPTHYAFTNYPGGWTTITVTALDAGDQPVIGAGIYLSYSQNRVCADSRTSCTSGGEASINGDTLTIVPWRFLTNNGPLSSQSGVADTGAVVIEWQPPGTLPTAGNDTITAQDSPSSPSIVAQDRLNF